MKKHLIAAAVAAAVAVPAAAQVTVYGILGAAVSDTTVKLSEGAVSAKVDTTNTGLQGLRSGHRLGFRSSEDLGGGMKAGFVYEIGITGEQGANGLGGANRLAYVDLSGGIGTIRLGKVDTLTRTVYNTYTVHGNSGFAPGNIGGSYAALAGSLFRTEILSAGGLTAAEAGTALSSGCTGLSGAELTDCNNFASALSFGGTRVNNSIGYISPSFSGFTAQLQYGQSDVDLDVTTNSTKTEQLNMGLSYNAGPLSIAYARDTDERNTENVVGSVEFTTDMIGASYDFGAAKAFLNYTSKKFEVTGDPETKIKDTTVGVSVPLGATSMFVSLSDGEISDGLKTDVKGYMVGANYAMSKRTTLFAFIGETAAKESTFKYKNDGFTLGVQHNF